MCYFCACDNAGTTEKSRRKCAYKLGVPGCVKPSLEHWYNFGTYSCHGFKHKKMKGLKNKRMEDVVCNPQKCEQYNCEYE